MLAWDRADREILMGGFLEGMCKIKNPRRKGSEMEIWFHTEHNTQVGEESEREYMFVYVCVWGACYRKGSRG